MKDITKLSDEEFKALRQQQKRMRDYALYEKLNEKHKASGEEFNVKEALKAAPGGIAAAVPDLLSGSLNLGLGLAEKGAQALGVPEHLARTPSVPYFGHDIAIDLTNKIFGEPQNQNEQQGRNIGNLLGGLAVGNPANLATAPAKLSGKLINSIIKLNPKKVEAFKEAGLIPTLADVSERGGIKHLQSALFSGVNRKADQRAAKLNAFFEGLEPLDLNQTGRLTSSGAKKYNEKASQVYNKLSERAWKNIDKTERVPLKKTLTTIQEELNAVDPETRTILAESEAGKEFTRLVNHAESYNDTVPFSDLSKTYKSKIGKLINSGELGDSEQKALKRVYGSLSEDLDEFVLARDPQALKDVKKANRFWHEFSEGNRNITNEAISKNKKSETVTFNGIKNELARGETRRADVLTKRLSQTEKKQFSDTLMNEMGRNEGQFSPFTWANNFNKMRPESKKIALSGLDREHAKKLTKVADALAHVKDTGKYGNFSNTQNNTAALATLIGAWHAPGITAETVALTTGAAELFSSPLVIDALYAASKAKGLEQWKKVYKHYAPIFSKRDAINQSDKSSGNSIQNLSDKELLELRQKRNQGAQNIVNPVANTGTRGDSDTLATKPFKKSTRTEREEEQGAYSFGSQH